MHTRWTLANRQSASRGLLRAKVSRSKKNRFSAPSQTLVKVELPKALCGDDYRNRNAEGGKQAVLNGGHAIFKAEVLSWNVHGLPLSDRVFENLFCSATTQARLPQSGQNT
jgi:hypothetical protein